LGVVVSLHCLSNNFIIKSVSDHFFLGGKDPHTFISYVSPKLVMRKLTKVVLSTTPLSHILCPELKGGNFQTWPNGKASCKEVQSANGQMLITFKTLPKPY
jgi:hypothetical protein